MSFRLRAAALLGGLAVTLSGPLAAAQDAPSELLYQALGAQPGLTHLVADLVDRLLADPRMRPFFKDSDLPHLKEQLVIQLCEVSGGPCHRVGKDMAKVHAGVVISPSDFNALVEVLQQSMDAQGIAFSVQNRLLARLAPMERAIVTR